MTGPVAAGKDTVARILAEQGAQIVDVDQAAHELYPQVSAQLQKEFHSTDRKQIAGIVFADPKKLKKLNAIIHPLLRNKITDELKNLRTKELKNLRTNELVVLNGAVLKEIGLIELCEEVWVVLAEKEKRLARLIEKSLSRLEAEARINSQMSDEEYRAIADVVIDNNGSPEELRAKIQDLLKV